MIIEHDIAGRSVRVDESIRDSLRKLDASHQGFLLCVDEAGVLEGVFTDGDVRRWLINQARADLSQPVKHLVNRDCVVAFDHETHDQIHARFADKIKFVPLLDNRRRLIGVVRRRNLLEGLKIGDRRIDDDSPVFVIAEVGINHNGSPELARRLVKEAKDAGVDSVKFQMRHLPSLYRSLPGGDISGEDLGAQYILNLLEKFELPAEEMLRLFDYTREQGLIPLCTPWEEESLAVLEAYGLEAYKVASADMTNDSLLEALCRTYKPLLLSTGMSTESEIRSAVDLLRKRGASYGLLHCNSTYPAPFKDINLNYLSRLKSVGGCPVGYSGHERGWNVAVAAVSMGARIVEKHITMDRSMEGSDHKASLLPHEFRQMVEGIRQVEESMGNSHPRALSQGEQMNRANLAKSLIAACDVEEGQIITETMIKVRSPGRGLQPNRKHELLGRRIGRKMVAGDFFFPSDVDAPLAKARNYSFNRPWGLTVRWHDCQDLASLSNPDFLEFHLSFKDMEEDFRAYIPEPLDLDLKVHSPDTFNGDHLLDLSNPNPAHRERSIRELQRVIDLTRELKPHFLRAERPMIIVSLGGFSTEGFLSKGEVAQRYAFMLESLQMLNMAGVEVIAQTLPPFPWYFGGQMYLNLFVKPEDTVAFCQQAGMRLCFDVSHTKMACNYYKTSFVEFVQRVGPYTAHLHVADAKGTDGEGLQIGEGELDFVALCELLRRECPAASFMPEIWQGHKNKGEGFWIALERLEKFGL